MGKAPLAANTVVKSQPSEVSRLLANKEGLSSRNAVFAIAGIAVLLVLMWAIYCGIQRERSTRTERTSPTVFESLVGAAARPKPDTTPVSEAPPKETGTSVGTEDPNIVTPNPGAIEGQVVSAATGQPVTDFEVTTSVEISSIYGRHDRLDRMDSSSAEKPPSGRELLGGSPPDNLPGFQPMNDAAGRFRIEQVKANKMVVVVRAEGYITGAQAVGRVEPGKVITGIVMRLEPECVVSGIVVDAQKRPVEGAAVFAERLPSSLPPPFALGPGQQTDANGAFRLTKLESIPSVIHAWKKGYAPAKTDVVSRVPKVERVIVVLTSGGSVEGVVKAGDLPATGARILVGPPNDLYSQVGHTNADENGLYRIDGIAPGNWIVDVAYAKEMGNTPNAPARMVRRPVVVEEGQVTQADFIFEAGATLQGTVTAGGVACPAAVQVVQNDSEDTTIEAETDAEGRYEITELPAGQLTVLVRPQGEYRGQYLTMAVTTLAGQTTYKDVDILKTSRIVGHATGIEELPEDAEIGVLLLPGRADTEGLTTERLLEWSSSLVAETQIEPGGTFVFNGGRNGQPGEPCGLAPGTYTVVVGAFPKGMATPDPSALLAIGSAVIETREGEEASVEVPLRASEN